MYNNTMCLNDIIRVCVQYDVDYISTNAISTITKCQFRYKNLTFWISFKGDITFVNDYIPAINIDYLKLLYEFSDIVSYFLKERWKYRDYNYDLS